MRGERFIAAYSQFVSVAGVPARHLQLYLLINCGHLFEDLRCPQALVRVDLAFVEADQADLCDLDPSPQADGRHATVYQNTQNLPPTRLCWHIASTNTFACVQARLGGH